MKIIHFLFLVLLAQPIISYASEDNAFIKLGRGITNVVTAPGEYYNAFMDHAENENLIVASVAGLFEGTYRTLGRLFVGLAEIVTFPHPGPNNYTPVLEPETGVSERFEFLKDPTAPFLT